MNRRRKSVNSGSVGNVTESGFIKGRYGWEADDLSLNFGVENEIIEFSARFSIYNNS
uniref:hypothetical protein n=1 Tax=uncultured Draconibacterium sp. TaxID=1573823 RepID=UPI0032179E35